MLLKLTVRVLAHTLSYTAVFEGNMDLYSILLSLGTGMNGFAKGPTHWSSVFAGCLLPWKLEN